MKKYIWAKDAPFAKKGDAFTVIGLREHKIEQLLTEGWIEEELPDRWKPEHGEDYYYFLDDLSCYKTFWSSSKTSPLDEQRYEAGNCFRTEELANKASQLIKETLLKFHEENQ